MIIIGIKSSRDDDDDDESGGELARPHSQSNAHLSFREKQRAFARSGKRVATGVSVVEGSDEEK